MRPNPMTEHLREELDALGVEWEGTDDHTEFDSGFEMHIERTDIAGVGSAIYSWTRDEDGRKRGDSMGYPAYLELQTDDGSVIATVEEIVGCVS